jgi:hypothetical protein
MKSIMSHARIAALLILALGLLSCGNATNYGGPPGTSGGLAISPSSITLELTTTSSTWSYAGGDITYFLATGGTPPYYWYQSNPELAIADPMDEGNDGVYRRIRYTTKPFSGTGTSSTNDVITVVDQAGISATVTYTISVTVESGTTS